MTAFGILQRLALLFDYGVGANLISPLLQIG